MKLDFIVHRGFKIDDVSYKIDNTFYLIKDNWDDFGFKTTNALYYIDNNSKIHNIGTVRIGFFGQSDFSNNINDGDIFSELDDTYFSLGGDDDYYIALNKLGSELRDYVLKSLNDIAKNENIYNDAISEAVTINSLLRGISKVSVTGQFRRIANGGARLTDYTFRFVSSESSNLSFKVIPESKPPTNIHILIGRNGSGKTNLLNRMIKSLTLDDDSQKNNERFLNESSDDSFLFANLIFISFSAFDKIKFSIESINKTNKINFNYIGLSKPSSIIDNVELKTIETLNAEFTESLKSCIRNANLKRWVKCITSLDSDPNFKNEISNSLYNETTTNLDIKKITKKFGNLSSGHKIILLKLTRLVETLEEKSLVIIDEPESHLHPPLISAFTRALSELLIDSNGVAIIATHSPVILQEVPSSCVWKIKRSNSVFSYDRLNLESFGESVGRLTNEVFGLEVTNSGFYNMIAKAVEESQNYEELLLSFDNRLGSEAKAIAMALFHKKKNG